MQENVPVLRGARYPVSLPSARAGQRRALDERLFVRFPALYRLLAERVIRLPLRSRLRRMMLTRIAGRGVAAANRRDFDVLLYGFDPVIELRLPKSQMGGWVPSTCSGWALMRPLRRAFILSVSSSHRACGRRPLAP
jgi:hypothetical protein